MMLMIMMLRAWKRHAGLSIYFILTSQEASFLYMIHLRCNSDTHNKMTIQPCMDALCHAQVQPYLNTILLPQATVTLSKVSRQSSPSSNYFIATVCRLQIPTNFICVCVCLSVCPAFTAYISLTIDQILIKLGENVETSIRLIVLKFENFAAKGNTTHKG